MNCCKNVKWIGAMMGLALVGAVAIADPTKDKPATGLPDMQLPPGWTAEDMQACMVAGTPGKQHEQLAKLSGEWTGTCTMWMAPGTQPMKAPCTATYTSEMDGRFVKCEMKGEMPGMGSYHGLGYYGYDNTSGKYQSTWVCNMGTNILNGVGDVSSDGNTTNWTYSYTCPITKKPAIIREIEKTTGPGTRTIETWSTDPKSGKEFKMMLLELKRK